MKGSPFESRSLMATQTVEIDRELLERLRARDRGKDDRALLEELRA
jgi:hypothetical protein